MQNQKYTIWVFILNLNKNTAFSMLVDENSSQYNKKVSINITVSVFKSRTILKLFSLHDSTRNSKSLIRPNIVHCLAVTRNSIGRLSIDINFSYSDPFLFANEF